MRGVARRKACQGESGKLLRRIQHPQCLQLIHLFRAVKAPVCIVLHQAAFHGPLFRLGRFAQRFAIQLHSGLPGQFPSLEGNVLAGRAAAGKARGGLDIVGVRIGDDLAELDLLFVGEKARLDDDL